MCGIIGVFNSTQAKKEVAYALSCLTGRGEDGDQIWSFERHAIGHRLHAVVNHVPQPFVGKGVFAANCELYNWKVLARKYGLKAQNDAHLLFLLLEQTRVKDISSVFEELDGDYAFVYIRKNRVWCARDSVGVKPLFFSRDLKKLAVASERQMLSGRVQELHPRQVLLYDAAKNTLHFVQRTFPRIHTRASTEKQFTTHLIEAVCKRIPEKQSLGVLFSGGIDSTVIAAIAKKQGFPVMLYTTVFTGKDIPPAKDLAQSQAVARALAIPHTVVRVSIDDVRDSLKTICATIGSTDPVKVAASMTTYFAARAAHKHGVKVLLSGSGADDLLGGYARQQDNASLQSDCISQIRKIFERDTYREDTTSMHHHVELRFPFLDRTVIATTLSLPPEVKRSDENKSILRSALVSLGYTSSMLFNKKTAAQYGSRADFVLKLLVKKSGFGGRKAAYLHSLSTFSNGRLAVLCSGGKDSLLAALIMSRKNYSLATLVTMKSSNADSYMFHTPAIDMVELQAKSMGVPVVVGETRGTKEAELRDLKKALARAQSQYHIEGIVTGAVASTYQRDRIDTLAEELGLKVYAPLWHKDQVLLLKELLSSGFTFVLTKTAAEGLDASWLNRAFDEEDVRKLALLQKKMGLHPAGEGGEFESLVLDMPLFSKRLELRETSVVSDDLVHTLHVGKACLVKK